MRILSISGQNIASLAERFQIDFTAEPLRSAGLFAITGETGAGKSSILDAMCLALYGEAPRLTLGSAQDEVPDAGGETIRARDARSILRRGAVQGWAAVTFTGLDGAAYEARWTARRARDRAEGKLQAVSRSVSRVSDGQVLASQLSAVTEQVQALTGLSYDEFRRTVLLAQGDFDAFLKADANDRADLLEKVTGTGLYRNISARVFQRTETARGVCDALILRRNEHRLLTLDEQAALVAERGDLAAQAAAAQTERAALTADLDRHSRIAAAQTRRAEAQALAALAVQVRADAAADHGRLHRIDRAAPLRPQWEAANTAEAALALTADALTEAETGLRQAQAEAAQHRDVAAAAQAALAAMEAEFKTFGPLWTEATQLDTQISSARHEAETAATKAAGAATEAAAARRRHAGLMQQMNAAQAAQSAASAQIDRLGAAAGLADRWDQIALDLSRRDSARQAQLQAEAEARELQTRVMALAEQTTALQQADQSNRDQRDRLSVQADGERARIAVLEADHPQDRAESLAALTAALGQLDRVRLDHHAAKAAHAEAEASKALADRQTSAAAATIAEAAAAVLRAETTATALAAPLERADMAASEAARQLRLRLQPGTACPVCGATDHPTPADAALATLAAGLRTDQSRARADALTARNRRSQAEGQAAGARARAAQALESIASQAKRADDAARGWKDGLQAARASGLRVALPETPDQAKAALATAIAQTEAARLATLEALRNLAHLRSSLAANDQQRDALTAAIEARSTQRSGLAETVAAAARDAALAHQTAAAQVARCGELDAALQPHLTAAGETAAALADVAALRARLQAQVAVVSTARQALQTAAASLTELAPQSADAASRADQLARAATEAVTATEARAAMLAELVVKRAGLLNGVPTETHRSRINDARLAAKAAHETAAAALGGSGARLGGALGHREAAASALAKAASFAAAAQASLTQALASSDLAAPELAAIFALPPAEVSALRLSLRGLDDAVTASGSALAARQTDLAQAQTGGVPETAADALAAALLALDAAQATRQERVGAINGQLTRDASTRATLIGLETEIATAKAEFEVWQAVNAAVGSRNGDKFARAAQSITLDVLVDRANHHLADLKPRYRLRRAADLALQIEDRDMGGEARATRSLSGGERFLVSLALALALSRMGGKGGLAATLFIDEGFGSLDAKSLDLAIDALETLQSQGRSVGVISHVEAMKDRVPVQISVKRQGNGKSSISIEAPPSG